MNAPATDEALSPDTHNHWAPQRRRTWFAIFGGPVAWGLHLAGGWYVSGNACLRGNATWGRLAVGDVWMLELAVAIACIGTCAAALFIAILDWRAAPALRLNEIHAPDRPDFLVAVGLLVSSVFLLGVGYDALAQLMLPLCEAVR